MGQTHIHQSHSEDEGDGSHVRLDRFNIRGKHAKALRAMMPGSFFKRGVADAKKIAEELVEGGGVNDLGSGDEGTGDKFGKVRVRHSHRSGEDPLTFKGDNYTDESGEELLSNSSSENENDAVNAWLGSFAPNRNRGTDKGDKLDRMLLQGRKTGIKSTKKARPVEKFPSKSHTAKADSQDRSAPTDLQAGNKNGDGRSKVRDRVPRVSLVNDDEIFRPSPSLPSRLNEISNRPTELLERPTMRNLPKGASHRFDLESLTYNRFSYDFSFQRLIVGLRLPSTSYTGRGHLQQLLDHFSHRGGGCSPQQTVAFDEILDSEASIEHLQALLPDLCDHIFDVVYTAVNSVEDLTTGSNAVDRITEPLRFYSLYLSSKLTTFSRSQQLQFIDHLSSQLRHLESRLKDVSESIRDPNIYSRLFSPLHWSFLEIDLRRSRFETDVYDFDDENRVVARLRMLIQGLLTRNGAMYTGKAIKSLHTASSTISPCEDCSIELWSRIISLAIVGPVDSKGKLLFSQHQFWQIVEDELAGIASEETVHPIRAFEALSYATMMLCALSQFSPNGNVVRIPRLSSNWSFIADVLETVRLNETDLPSDGLKNSVLADRDRYIWTLFARCLIFAERWNWRVDGQYGIVQKLYDILNTRQLKNLLIDHRPEFPSFLSPYNGTIDKSLESRADGSFHIFLKMVLRLAEDVEGDTAEVRKRNLSRSLVRITPMRKMPFTRDAARTSTDRSILYNHYSLFITLILASPTSFAQRLSQTKSLLSFEDADNEARLVMIRAIMYLAIVCLYLKIPLNPILEWLASISKCLFSQYNSLEASKINSTPSGLKDASLGQSERSTLINAQRENSRISVEMFNVARLLSMVLRAVQHMLTTDVKINSFPETLPIYPKIVFLNHGKILSLTSRTMFDDMNFSLDLFYPRFSVGA